MFKKLVYVGAAVAAIAPYLVMYAKSKDTSEFYELYREKDRDIKLLEKLAKREHLRVIMDDTELLAATLGWLDFLNGTNHVLDIVGYPPEVEFMKGFDDEDDIELESDEMDCSRTTFSNALFVTEDDIWALKFLLDDDIDKQREVYHIISNEIYDAPISVLDVNMENCI